MLLVIAGATASGKSALAIAVAKKIGGEIISADSMQVYKGIDIGTAKINTADADGIKHHLIDIVSAKSAFSVAEFVEFAENAIRDIESRGKIPIVCGGTGLYIRALLYPFQFGNVEKNENFRKTLFEEAKIYGNTYLHNKLELLNSEKAEVIHENNVKRVIRAIEIATFGEMAQSELEKTAKRPFLFFILDADREVLYNRINSRVETMINYGLKEEVLGLLSDGVTFDMQSMQAIGYREWRDFIENKKTEKEVLEEIKKCSRNYAKRQITWFKKETGACHVDTGEKQSDLVNLICDYYEKSIKQEYSTRKNLK